MFKYFFIKIVSFMR